MKSIGWLFYWLVAGGLMVLSVNFATSNLDPVPLKFWPFPGEAVMPLFLFAIGVFGFGFFFGAFIAWVNSSKARGRARRAERLMREEERKTADLKRKLEAVKSGNRKAESSRAIVPVATE
jgi:uncharacterized integral membrane protein